MNRFASIFLLLSLNHAYASSDDGPGINGPLKYIHSLKCTAQLGLNDYPLGKRNGTLDSTFTMTLGNPSDEGWQEEQRISGKWTEDLGYTFRFGPTSLETKHDDGSVYSVNYSGHLSIIRYTPEKKIMEGRFSGSIEPSDSYSFQQKTKKPFWLFGNNLKFVNVLLNSKKELPEALVEADASGQYKIGDWIEVNLLCDLYGKNPDEPAQNQPEFSSELP